MGRVRRIDSSAARGGVRFGGSGCGILGTVGLAVGFLSKFVHGMEMEIEITVWEGLGSDTWHRSLACQLVVLRRRRVCALLVLFRRSSMHLKIDPATLRMAVRGER
jgi:hypothetical protein